MDTGCPPLAEAWPPDAPVEARASVRRLLQLVERERVSLVVSSHDAGQWAELGRGAAIHE